MTLCSSPKRLCGGKLVWICSNTNALVTKRTHAKTKTRLDAPITPRPKNFKYTYALGGAPISTCGPIGGS